MAMRCGRQGVSAGNRRCFSCNRKRHDRRTLADPARFIWRSCGWAQGGQDSNHPAFRAKLGRCEKQLQLLDLGRLKNCWWLIVREVHPEICDDLILVVSRSQRKVEFDNGIKRGEVSGGGSR